MKCVEVPAGGRYSDIPGMDPRADWLLGPGLDDYLPDVEHTLIPFIMTLYDEQGLAFVKTLLKKEPPFYISSLHNKKLEVGRGFPGFAPKSFFDDLVDNDKRYGDLRATPKEIKLCLPLPSSQPDWTPGEQLRVLDKPTLTMPEGGWPDTTVVIGVIDDGIAFAHERFRDAAGGSRVQCFWRQDGPHRSTTVDSGIEIFKAGEGGIDALLMECKVAGAVDEEWLYRRAGLIDFAEPGHKTAAWQASHGTHVLDVAAGEDPADEVANRPIIGVQLDPAVVEDTSLADIDDKLLHAIDYILERADAMAGDAGPLPVVINFSFGNIAGPHDGTSRLELEIDERIRARSGRLQVVLPAGNSHLSRCHAEISFAPEDDVVELYWRVQPDDLTASFMEIWLPHEGADAPESHRMQVSVKSPDGDETTPLGEIHGDGFELSNNGKEICAVRYQFKPFPTERGVFLIDLQPTARLHPTGLDDKIAPAGTWTVRLKNLSLRSDEVVHAWIQRDDQVYSYPRRGRQSYFDQPCYARYDSQGREIEEDDHPEQPACVVTRKSLINAIATGEEPVVTGAFVRRDLKPARYSAGGPVIPKRGGTLDPAFRKPDAMTVGDDSRVHAGVLAAGSRSGSVVGFTGTSVAAPGLARWIAGELGAGRPGDRAAVKAEAQAQEANHPTDKPPLPPDRGSWGRIVLPPVIPIPRCLSAFDDDS